MPKAGRGAGRADKKGNRVVENRLAIMIYGGVRSQNNRENEHKMGNADSYHVATGTFEVGNTQSRVLQAYLGTCVGVAVADPTAGVGGLIHLLLPEPVGADDGGRPATYAATGVPLFLKHLLDLGGTVKHMKAVVAGGALVGPLSDLDMHLDIGGRTAEKAYSALHEAGVSVSQAETGGFFTCCLELDMRGWQWDIRPAGFEAETSPDDASAPVTDRILKTIETIKPIPQVALKVLRIVEAGDFDVQQVAAEVRKDQVMTARTIQLCNSALYSRPAEIATLDHALVYLGQDRFVRLVISAAVQRYYDQSGNGYSLCKGGLYHHAIGTAMTAEKIAARTAAAPPGQAYIAGLLHDIGKVVLDQFVARVYPMFYRGLQDAGADILDLENRILGKDHTRVGHLLARKWQLPEALADAIRFHHVALATRPHSALTTIVYLADLLMSRFHPGLELERLGTAHLAEYLARLDLTPARLPELVNIIPPQVFAPPAQRPPSENRAHG
jgi:putative nucleotidyltransferase with HDIG domain